MPSVFVARYACMGDLERAIQEAGDKASLRLPLTEANLSDPPPRVGEPVQVSFQIPGHPMVELCGEIESIEAEQVWIGFDPGALLSLRPGEGAKRTSAPMPIRRRLQRMSMEDKINLALSGNREERRALAADSNKAIHHYLLRNARMTLEEVAAMARMPSLNPDVLDKIADNPQYAQNLSIIKALIYNPKTPVPTSIRLLDRLPRQEVINVSKRPQMHTRLVLAAKKKVESHG